VYLELVIAIFSVEEAIFVSLEKALPDSLKYREGQIGQGSPLVTVR
jgi:hypothetical protein